MITAAACFYLFATKAIYQGKTSTYSGVDYVLPANWEAKDGDGVRIIMPSKQIEGQLLLFVLAPALPKQGKTWADTFKAFLTEAEKEAKPTAREATQSLKRGDFEIFLQAQSLKNDQMGEYNALYQMVCDDQKAAAGCLVTKGEEIFKQNEEGVTSLLASIHPHNDAKPKPPTKGSSNTTNGVGKIPTRNASGSETFLSGKGTKIPTPSIASGKPAGMWWNQSIGVNNFNTVIYSTIFLPDNTMIKFPKFGGPLLVDIEGQRASENGSDNIGTFTVSGGRITTNVGDVKHDEIYTTGKDDSGPFFKIGSMRYRPCEPVTAEFLMASKWRIPGSTEYQFGPNGVLTTATAYADENVAASSRKTGRWIQDGYLLYTAAGQEESVDKIYKFSKDAIVIGQRLFFRVK